MNKNEKQKKHFYMNRETNFNYNSCQITFFKSNIQGLNGFAGIDQIYISLTELKIFYETFPNMCSTKDELIIVKMYLLRLVLHEMTHVVFRQTLNDFNLSSPIINVSNCQTPT